MKTEKYLFSKVNYILMVVGLLLIGIGYLLMMGGGSEDPNVFNPEIFNSTRIKLAPSLLVLGFVVEIVAIMWRSKSNTSQGELE